MAVILDEIAQQHTDYVQGQYNDTGHDNSGIHFLRDIDIEHFVGYNRVHHTNHRDQQGGQHIQGQHFPVRFIITNKTFKHGVFLPFLSSPAVHRTYI